MERRADAPEITCEQCREWLDQYLARSLKHSSAWALQQHLAGCAACCNLAIARAQARIATGTAPMQVPPHLRESLLHRVLVSLRGILHIQWFPRCYTFAPAVAGALDDQAHIYTTPDQQFIVEVTPVPTASESTATVELAIRAHQHELQGSRIRYRIYTSDKPEPIQEGETTLDEEGLGRVEIRLPVTMHGPYQFDIKAFPARENDAHE